MQAAERIIREAYGVARQSDDLGAIRYELLGGCVAVAVLGGRRDVGQTCVRLARRLANGRSVQMRKASRRSFATLREFVAYFDDIYARYGLPNE